MIPGSPPPQPLPVPPPPRRRRTGLIVGLLVAALVVIGGGLVVALITIRAHNPATAQVGDCLSYDKTRDQLRRADCSADEANLRLIGFADSSSGCAEVPGATEAVPGRSRSYCVGEKNADPTTAVNTVVAGDCLAVTADRAEKASCRSGTYPMLAVLKNRIRASQNDLDYACHSVEGADLSYGWSISGDPQIAVGTWNRILCLAPKH